MNKAQQTRFNSLYQRHVSALQRQGKAATTIDVYCRAVRRITEYFNHCPDRLTEDQLKDYFTALVKSHSWSTVKVDRNGLQFFYKHVLNKRWTWVDIVKPPQKKVLPDILTLREVERVINGTRELRYQTFILTAYSIGLRLGESAGGCVPRKACFSAAPGGLSTPQHTREMGGALRTRGQGLPALQYLSRYLYRGVISNKQIVSDDGDFVTFRYKESKTGATKTRRLRGEDFIALVLQHTLPKGFRRARDYGFLHGNAKRLLQTVQWILQVTIPRHQEGRRPPFLCQQCQAPMSVVGFTGPHAKPG